MQKILSSLTSFPTCRCGSSWGRRRSGAVRFWTFVFFMFACKQQQIKQEALLIRTGLERCVVLGCTDVWCVCLPQQICHSVWSRSINGSGYLIVTSSVCGAQHPERWGWRWGVGVGGDISAVQKDTLTDSCISQAAFTPHWGSLSLIDVKALQH